MLKNIKRIIVLSKNAKRLKKLENERTRVEEDSMISPFQTRRIIDRLEEQESKIINDVLVKMA